MSTDQIRKQIVLQASRERVWRAITDPSQFGEWFGAELRGSFTPGQETAGTMAPTKVDPEIAKMQEPYRGMPFCIVVEQIVPMRLFSFRWHPDAVDPTKVTDADPTTLIEFELAEVDGGILLTITESGFDQLPPDRRDIARRNNDGGWEHQTRMIARYLALGGEREA